MGFVHLTLLNKGIMYVGRFKYSAVVCSFIYYFDMTVAKMNGMEVPHIMTAANNFQQNHVLNIFSETQIR